MPGTTRTFQFQMTDQPAGGGKAETFSLSQTMKYVTPQLATAEMDRREPQLWHAAPGKLWPGDVHRGMDDREFLDQLDQPTGERPGDQPGWGGTTFAVPSNPPVVANTLGYNEPASGQKSSSFTVTYK